MRPVHTVPNAGTLREVTIWKAIVLSIVTIGIYYLVLVYQNSKDLQASREKTDNLWMLWYWLGFITMGLTWIVLYVFNGQAYAELRNKNGQGETSLWVVALVMAILLAPVGQIIWAAHFNDGIRAAASGTTGSATAPPLVQAA